MMNFKYILMVMMIALTGPVAGDELQTQIEECEACHGPGGVSDQDDIPSLAGKTADEIKDDMGQFYFYERHCPTTTYRHGTLPPSPMNMCNIASRLSPEEVEAISLYFSAKE